MSNLQEKLAFSERLKQALIDSNHPISPTYLSKEFNHRYDGTPVSVQSANNWLLGKAIPNQDKLAILSIWLNVTSQWLRFGDNTLGSSNLESKDQSELDYFLKFRTLNATQKQIIKDLIDQFIQR